MASRPPDDRPDDEAARNRWMVIQVMRIFGFGLAILGILLTQGVVDLAGEVNVYLGYAFIAIGLVDGFVMPAILARKWSSRRQ